MTKVPKVTISIIGIAILSTTAAISEPTSGANLESDSNRYGGKPISFNEKRSKTSNFTKQLVGSPILRATETVNGLTTEEFSDGLVVQIDSSGNRNERLTSANFALESKVPDAYHHKSSKTVDSYIGTLLNLGRMKGQNSSLLQSRLFQYSSYYLSLGETSKAQPLVKEFFEIQNRIHEKGEPFTDAEKKYRLALKGSE